MALATLSIDLEARLAGLEAGLDKAARIAKQNADKIQQQFDGLRSVGSGLAASLAAAFSVSAITLFVRTTIDGVDALNDLKDATGASIEKLSALEDVAARNGTAFETVGTALTKFNGLLKDAGKGSDTEKILRGIGLSVVELRKLDPAEALQRVALALNKYADDGNKARIIQELFGKSVKEVAPFLKDLAESGELNAKVTTKQAEEAEKFNKQLFALQKNAKDASRSLLSDLLPALNNFLERSSRAGGVLKLVAEGFKVDFGQARLQAFSDKIADLTNEAIKLQKELNFSESRGLPSNRDTVARLAEVRKELLELQERSRAAGEQIKGVINATSPPTSGRRPPNEGGGRFAPPEAPEVSGLTAKVAGFKLPEQAGAKDDALTAAINRIDNTTFAKLGRLNEELAKLLLIRDELGSGGGVDEAIANITREIEDLDPAFQSAAENAQRLKDLLDATPTGQIEKLRGDMELLAAAFERGEIGAEAFSEAAQTRLGILTDKLQETSTFAEQAGRNIQDALGDTLVRTLKGDFESIGELWKNLLIQMASQAIAAQFSQLLFGDFGKTGNIGGLIGDGLKFLGFMSTGSEYVPSDGIAYLHKGERVVPADQNRQGSWGGGMSMIFSPQTSITVQGNADVPLLQRVLDARDNALRLEFNRAFRRGGLA